MENEQFKQFIEKALARLVASRVDTTHANECEDQILDQLEGFLQGGIDMMDMLIENETNKPPTGVK